MNVKMNALWKTVWFQAAVFAFIVVLVFYFMIRPGKQGTSDDSKAEPDVVSTAYVFPSEEKQPAAKPTEEKSAEEMPFTRPIAIRSSDSERKFSDLQPSFCVAEMMPIVAQKMDGFDSKLIPIAQAPKPVPPPSVAVPAKPGKKSESKSSEWVPFVFFYQTTRCGTSPSSIFFFYPTENIVPTTQKPLPCNPPSPPCPVEFVCPPPQPLVPVIYPIYPVCPVYSVYPVFQPMQPQVFMPTVVPSFHGMPKLVYPNGVVVKPKVYVPGQPLKNVLRAVTP